MGKSRDDLCTWLIISIILTLLYILFGTAIPTSLDNFCNCFLLVSIHFINNIGHIQNIRTGVQLQKFRKQLMLVCRQWLIELDKALNTCSMVQCLAERRCRFENLVECKLNCRWHSMYQVWWYLAYWMSWLATQSFKLQQFWWHWNSCSPLWTQCGGNLSFYTYLQSRPHVATQHDTSLSYRVIALWHTNSVATGPLIQILSIYSYWPMEGLGTYSYWIIYWNLGTESTTLLIASLIPKSVASLRKLMNTMVQCLCRK